MIPPYFFPGEVSRFFTYEKSGVDALSPMELELAKSYGAKRFADFCTGRHCLRECTRKYGFSGDILIGERGMPLLPPHLTASLSHSKKLSGAIAAPREKFSSLGLDIETIGRVSKDMWHLLFTKDETSFLNEQDSQQQSFFSTVFFSLKEAFYKLQYPITGVFLDFHDVEILVDSGSYGIRVLKPGTGNFREEEPVEGHFIKYEEEIITFCSLPPVVRA